VRASRGAFQDGPNPDLDDIVAFAQDFDPDVIYCQPLQFPRYYWWLPRYLSAVLDRPIVTHVMDDWPNMIESRDRAEGRELWVEKLHACLQDLFDNSAANLGISHSMGRDYRQRYGHSFEVIQNSIEKAEWENVHKDYELKNGLFKIMYVGKIFPFMQHDSLKDIGEVASRMTRNGKPVDFIIHGPEHLAGKYGKDIFAQSAVHYGGFLPREAFVDSLVNADLLVVPVNFDEDSLRFAQHSMPAKVPEYMASSTPILVYAPKTTPPAEYATKSGWGIVVGERDLDLLEKRITELMETPALSRELGQKARALALENHSFESTRTRFRQILRDAAATRASSLIRDVTDLLVMTRTRIGLRRLAGNLPEPVKTFIRRRPARKTPSSARRTDRANESDDENITEA
jgi:glycosyltransferase involved in cell wall biosynthesis